MISTIGDISAATTTADTSSSSSTLSQEDFLEILIAQMQNQDPLEPMNNTDYTAVLAQFSSLAQLSSISTKLDDLAESVESSSAANATNLIGKEVSAAGDTITVSDSSTNIIYNLSEDAATVEVNVYDEDGILTTTFLLGDQSAGLQSVIWDTTDVDSGDYNVVVSAYDSDGNTITTDTYITGTVTGVTAESGTLCVVVSGQNIPYDDIVSIQDASA